LLLAGALAAPAGAQVQVQELAKGNGITHLRVSNGYFDVEFAPESGATASSFKTRYGDKEWIFPGYGGMFRTVFVGVGFPTSDLAWIKHTYQILDPGPEQVVLEFRTLTKENVTVYRKMTFPSGSPVVRVQLGMINEGAQSTVQGLWPDFMMYLSGVPEHNRYYRPSIRGVSETGWDDQTKTMTGTDYERNPYEGWTAALNTSTGEGLVWLMDYNWLKLLYNCNNSWTAEWSYDYATLPKGGKWETEYDMILTKGFPGFCHASPQVIAGMTMTPRGDRLEITHTLSRSVAGNLKDVRLTAQLRGVDSGEVHDLPALTCGDLTWEPQRQVQTIPVKMDQRLVCDVELTGLSAAGASLQESYSYYWPGSQGEGFDLMAGAGTTTYRRPAPRKVKEFLKPPGLAYYRKPEPRMLECRGPFYHYFRVPELATRAGISVIEDSYLTQTFAGTSLTYFPGSYEEMFKQDLLVLNNVTAPSLTDFGQDAVREFVKAGGSLLVLGGQFSLGAGAYRNSVLGDVLPVQVSATPFDLVRLDPPGRLMVAPAARVLHGLKLPETSACFWLNAVQPKPDAWVEITAGDRPFLICGRYGAGKVAVVAGTVCGEPVGTQRAFWETDDWPDLLCPVLRWMLGDTP
jgi:uncharacterized membrane protein